MNYLVNLDIWEDMVTALWAGLVTVGDWLYNVTMLPLALALTAAWNLTILWLEASGLGIIAVPLTVMIWTVSVLIIMLGLKIMLSNLTSW